MNVSFMFSLVIFFSLLVAGVSTDLSSTLYHGLVAQNVSSAAALGVSRLPPTTVLFAALLGYNPMESLLPQSILGSLPAANRNTILGTSFFPTIISKPFINGLHIVFYIGAAFAFISALASAITRREKAG